MAAEMSVLGPIRYHSHYLRSVQGKFPLPNQSIKTCHSTGVSCLLSLTCLLWLMMNPPNKDDPAEDKLRQILCGINVLMRYTQLYFFNQLFLNTTLWRIFLILYAEGFIRNGKENLDLFVQLFWVLSFFFISAFFGMWPLSILIRGDNILKTGTTGQLCLYIPLGDVYIGKGGDDLDGQPVAENLYKRMAIRLVVPFLQIVAIVLLTRKSKRFLKDLCPHNKMSLIGKHQRNLMTFMETATIAIFWNIKQMFEVYLQVHFRNHNFSPVSAFYTESTFMLVFSDVPILIWTVVLSLRDIPSNDAPPKATKFYVRMPCSLEPRRPPPQQGIIPRYLRTSQAGTTVMFSEEILPVDIESSSLQEVLPRFQQASRSRNYNSLWKRNYLLNRELPLNISELQTFNKVLPICKESFLEKKTSNTKF